MEGLDLSKLIIPLITGGVMGTILTQVCITLRNRVQAVGYKVDVLPLFKKNIEGSNLITNITISDEGNEYTFENLFIINVLISNKGNKDIDEFRFSITLREGDKLINVEQKYVDKYHKMIEVDQKSSPKQTLGEADLCLKPFNRKDLYDIRLYVVIPEKNEEPGEIKFSSPVPVKFTSIPSASEAAISIGKFAFQVVANSAGDITINSKWK